jgi:membrane protease YdiL (CAAX protease family)
VPDFLKEFLQSPDLLLVGSGLAVWAVWGWRRSRNVPSPLSGLPVWATTWVEIIFFLLNAFWFQLMVSKLFITVVASALELAESKVGEPVAPELVAALSVASPVGFLLAWWVFPKMQPGRTPPPPLEHLPLGWGQAFLRAVPLYLAWMPVLVLSLLAMERILPDSDKQETLKVFTSVSPLLQALIFLGAAVGAPLAEECVFRAGLFRMLKGRFSLTNAAALSAIIFAAIHLYPAGLPSLFLFGLFLAYAYERHGSLKVPILLHAMNNGVSLILALLLETPSKL